MCYGLPRQVFLGRTSIVERADERTGNEDMSPGLNTSSIHVFIAHSHEDAELAKRLIALLRSATPIDPRRIRCSSVPEHELPGGVVIGAKIREEILNAPVFIALLTRESLKSTYVSFEMGARWGFGVHSENRFKLIPLLAAGMNRNELREPINEFSVRSCDQETSLHQLVEEVCSELDLPPRSPIDYGNAMKELKEKSAAIKRERQKLPPPGQNQFQNANLQAETYIQLENMKKVLRDAFWHHNKKRSPKKVIALANFARISETEALKVLRRMPDMIVEEGNDGQNIVKKKSR
jgi:hypothetical protein